MLVSNDTLISSIVGFGYNEIFNTFFIFSIIPASICFECNIIKFAVNVLSIVVNITVLKFKLKKL